MIRSPLRPTGQPGCHETPVICPQTRSLIEAIRRLAPSPTARCWAGSVIRGVGAPFGSFTGRPGGRLSMRSTPLLSASTQSSRSARACHRVSVRGVTSRVAWPAASVVTTPYASQAAPGRLRKRRKSPASGSPSAVRHRTRSVADRSSTTLDGPPRVTFACRSRIGTLPSWTAGGWVASPAYVALTRLSSAIRETAEAALARPAASVTTVPTGCQTPPVVRSIRTDAPATGAPVSSPRARVSVVVASAGVAAADSVSVVAVAALAAVPRPTASARAHTTTQTLAPSDMRSTFPRGARPTLERGCRLPPSYDEDRHVVALRAGVVADSRAQPGHQAVGRLPDARPEDRLHAGHAELLAGGISSLEQTVRERHEHRAALEAPGLDLPGGLRQHAADQGPRRRELDERPADGDQRRRMAGVDVGQPVRRGFDHGDEDRREELGLTDQPVPDGREDRRHRGRAQHRRERTLQPQAHHRRLRSVPGDVAEEHHDPAVAEVDDVEEVAGQHALGRLDLGADLEAVVDRRQLRERRLQRSYGGLAQHQRLGGTTGRVELVEQVPTHRVDVVPHLGDLARAGADHGVPELAAGDRAAAAAELGERPQHLAVE